VPPPEAPANAPVPPAMVNVVSTRGPGRTVAGQSRWWEGRVRHDEMRVLRRRRAGWALPDLDAPAHARRRAELHRIVGTAGRVLRGCAGCGMLDRHRHQLLGGAAACRAVAGRAVDRAAGVAVRRRMRGNGPPPFTACRRPADDSRRYFGGSTGCRRGRPTRHARNGSLSWPRRRLASRRCRSFQPSGFVLQPPCISTAPAALLLLVHPTVRRHAF